jgi:hypothetical protein
MTEEFIKEINELVSKNTNFKVNRIPVSVLDEFKFFCKEECGDVYWVGIKQLLKTKRDFENILPLLSSLNKEIEEIKNQLKNKVKEEPKTFSR